MIIREQLTTRKKTPYTLPELDLEIQDQVKPADRDTCRVMVEIYHARAFEDVITYGAVVSDAEFMGSRLVFPTSRVNPTSKEREDVTIGAASLMIPAQQVATLSTPGIKCLTVNEFLKVIQTTEENCKRFGNEPEFVLAMPLVAVIYSSEGTSKSWFITRVEYNKSRQILFLSCDLIDDARTDAYRLLRSCKNPIVRFIDAELGI